MISKTFQNFQLQSIKNIKKLGKFQKKIDKLSDQIADKILVDHIVVPSNKVMRIQDSHLLLTHYLAELIEKKLSSHNNF